MCPETPGPFEPASSRDRHTGVHNFTCLLRAQLQFCIAALVPAATKAVFAGQESTKTLTQSPDAARQKKLFLLAKETHATAPVLVKLAVPS